MVDRSIAIIPARGGSKRIPRKNVRLFLGEPILAYPIKACLASGLFETVLVSTDDDEIAALAVELGAEVPFRRSPQTSDDFATTADVLLEVLLSQRARGYEFSWACCCYPTAPLLTPETLRRAAEKLEPAEVDGVIPVCRYSTPIWRALQLEEGRLRLQWPEYENSRSQDLPHAYYDSGQFYLFKVASFLQTRSLFMPNTAAIELSEAETQDIDNEIDWKLAELKYSLLGRDLRSHP